MTMPLQWTIVVVLLVEYSSPLRIIASHEDDVEAKAIAALHNAQAWFGEGKADQAIQECNEAIPLRPNGLYHTANVV